jgi:hypothetical protein
VPFIAGIVMEPIVRVLETVLPLIIPKKALARRLANIKPKSNPMAPPRTVFKGTCLRVFSDKITRIPMSNPIPRPHNPELGNRIICCPKKNPLLPVTTNIKTRRIITE